MTSTIARRTRRRSSASPSDIEAHLTRARQLQAEAQRIDLLLAEERSWLLSHMQQLDTRELRHADFVVYRRVRHNWDYSPATQREMLALRNLQQSEQRSGVAADRPTEYVSLCFKPTA